MVNPKLLSAGTRSSAQTILRQISLIKNVLKIVVVQRHRSNKYYSRILFTLLYTCRGPDIISGCLFLSGKGEGKDKVKPVGSTMFLSLSVIFHTTSVVSLVFLLSLDEDGREDHKTLSRNVKDYRVKTGDNYQNSLKKCEFLQKIKSFVSDSVLIRWPNKSQEPALRPKQVGTKQTSLRTRRQGYL